MVHAHLDDERSTWGCLFGWLFTHELGEVVSEDGYAQLSRTWMDEWLLSKLVASALQDLGLDEPSAWQAVAVTKILISHQGWFDKPAPKKARAYQTLISWLRDGEVQQFVQVNRYRGVLWFNKEGFDQFLHWMLTLAAVEISADPGLAEGEVAGEIVACYDVVDKLRKAEEASEYKVAELIEAAKG
jgi:hypothetical protein